MSSYIIRRLLIMVPTVALIAVLTFVVVELPPGDYASRVADAMEQRGENVDMSTSRRSGSCIAWTTPRSCGSSGGWADS